MTSVRPGSVHVSLFPRLQNTSSSDEANVSFLGIRYWEEWLPSTSLSGDREPSVRRGHNEEENLLKCWCSEGQKETWHEVSARSLSVTEPLVLQPAALWSRILSFYRIVMSLLPPPLFTTDKEWNWSVRGTAACALSSRHRHQEPRWENLIKLYTVCFNWALDPL